MRFSSPNAALKQGIGAASAGEPDLAIPALRYAATHGSFHAEYYLARVLSIGSGPHVDHGEAFQIFQRIVSEYRTIDPFYDYRAPFVARAALHMALYFQSGIPDAGIPANPVRARRILEYAAPYFDDASAQFELGRMYAAGIGGPEDVSAGRHYLMQASRKGHVSAQAELATWLWSGPETLRDPIRGLVLISLALEQAPPEDELWIAEQHHQMFCTLGVAQRQAALGLVEQWRNGELPDLAPRQLESGDAETDAAARANADARFLFQARRLCSDGMRMDGELIMADALEAPAPAGVELVRDPAGVASSGTVAGQHIESSTQFGASGPLTGAARRMGLGYGLGDAGGALDALGLVQSPSFDGQVRQSD